MARLRRIALVVLIPLVLVGVSASDASAQLPTEDSVSGFGGVVDPGTGTFFTDIMVDAHSDPGGANPSGTVSFRVFAFLPVAGPVTCLAVDGNRALIGFTSTVDPFTGPMTVEIVDNASTGLPDTFFARLVGTDCLSDPPPFPPATGGPLFEGDFVVREALTRLSQCLKGGWRDYTDEQGQLFFKNQGDCIQFVNLPT